MESNEEEPNDSPASSSCVPNPKNKYIVARRARETNFKNNAGKAIAQLEKVDILLQVQGKTCADAVHSVFETLEFNNAIGIPCDTVNCEEVTLSVVKFSRSLSDALVDQPLVIPRYPYQREGQYRSPGRPRKVCYDPVKMAIKNMDRINKKNSEERNQKKIRSFQNRIEELVNYVDGHFTKIHESTIRTDQIAKILGKRKLSRSETELLHEALAAFNGVQDSVQKLRQYMKNATTTNVDSEEQLEAETPQERSNKQGTSRTAVKPRKGQAPQRNGSKSALPNLSQQPVPTKYRSDVLPNPEYRHISSTHPGVKPGVPSTAMDNSQKQRLTTEEANFMGSLLQQQWPTEIPVSQQLHAPQGIPLQQPDVIPNSMVEAEKRLTFDQPNFMVSQHQQFQNGSDWQQSFPFYQPPNNAKLQNRMLPLSTDFPTTEYHHLQSYSSQQMAYGATVEAMPSDQYGPDNAARGSANSNFGALGQYQGTEQSPQEWNPEWDLRSLSWNTGNSGEMTPAWRDQQLPATRMPSGDGSTASQPGMGSMLSGLLSSGEGCSSNLPN